VPFGQTTALAAPAGGERETIGAGLEVLGQVPANLTTLLALSDSNTLTIAGLSYDEQVSSTPPILGAQAAGVAGMSQPAALAARASQGLAARMQAIVQPLVRSINALGDNLRAILRSIFPILPRPRPVSNRVGASASVGQFSAAGGVSLPALPTVVQDDLMETWDLALQSQREDWPSVAEPDRDLLTSDGNREPMLFIVALMAIGLNGVRSAGVPLPRSLSATKRLWSEPRNHAGLPEPT
jgi:hypothetical protein